MFDALVSALGDMKEDEALSEAAALVAAGADPLQILESCSAAMGIVGQRFEAGEYFLPELMMAGDLVRRISDLLKPALERTTAPRKKGTVVIATVKGDIHHLGKDIVAFLLDVNGFEVRDLGVDVAPATIVAAVRDCGAEILALSGLLTVAYDSMKQTVQAIEAGGLRDRVRIMIGGAQVSDRIRQYTGADAFGQDAVAGVRLAAQWIG
jgi:methanogenic corrinoid protein MtbC1